MLILLVCFKTTANLAGLILLFSFLMRCKQMYLTALFYPGETGSSTS